METQDIMAGEIAGAAREGVVPEIEHFVHARGKKPIVALGARHRTLREVLVEFEVEIDAPEGVFVFVGECREALDEAAGVDDGVDVHAPVDIDLTLEVLEIERHRHVHCHTCRHVAVEVAFMGLTKRHRFSPATPISVVTAWARRAFPNVDAVAVAEFVLQVAGSKLQPRGDEHVGEIVANGTCAVSFVLVKDVTHLG